MSDSYRAQSPPNLLQSRSMSSVRSLTLQNSSSGVDPAKGSSCAKINFLRLEPPDGRVHNNTGARSVSQPQSGVPLRMDSPPEMDSICFVITTRSILHLEGLDKQCLCFRNAPAEHNEAVLIVLLGGGIGADRGDVVLDRAEIRNDLLDAHRANLVNWRTQARSAVSPLVL